MDDQGTFLTIGGGLVTIVVVATALSSFMENRAARAESKAAIRQHVEEDRLTIERLKDEVAEAKSRWIESGGKKGQNASLEVARKAVTLRQTKLDELRARRTDLNDSISKSEAEFVSYRSDYRIWTRNAAAGESVGDLRTLDGRDYQNVVISRVTDEGIEIRHSNGVARIGSEQLVESWHRRFQWEGQTAISVSK